MLFSDFHTRSVVVYRIWLIFAGGISILGVPYWFNALEQGYFYTFSSLIAAQVLFELGLSFVIAQFTAHEIGSLSRALEPDNNLSRLAHLFHFSDVWFQYIAIGFLMIVGPVGYLFFIRGPITGVDWQIPWIILVLASALNLRYGARLAMVEGTGEVGQVAQLRLIQSMLGHVLMWTVLFFGWKLWAMAMVPLFAFIVTVSWLHHHHFILAMRERIKKGLGATIDWHRDYFPMQWRIALSWASGYLIFQAITPIVFVKLGPVSAGQIGLALAIFNGVQTLGMSWMNSRAPEFGELIVRNELAKLNALFINTFKKANTIVALGVGIVIIGDFFLRDLNPGLAARIPDEATLTCFGVATIVNAMIFSMALYMRCHKEEPMLAPSVIGGLLVLLGVYIGASNSILLTAFIYMLLACIIGLPWAWVIFNSYFQKK